MFRRLDRILKILEKPLHYLAGFFLFIMMLHVVADVFARYALSKPITGTLEIVSNYYMIAIVFLPLALVQRYHGHIKVEVFSSLLSRRTVIYLDIFATILTLGYVGLMCWLVVEEAIKNTLIFEKMVVGVALLPLWPARWLVPIGVSVFVMAVIYSLMKLLIEAATFPTSEKAKEAD